MNGIPDLGGRIPRRLGAARVRREHRGARLSRARGSRPARHRAHESGRIPDDGLLGALARRRRNPRQGSGLCNRGGAGHR